MWEVGARDLSRLGDGPRHRAGGSVAAVPGVGRGLGELVSGDEALKIWVTRALRPESQRFRYTAWSADYGNELTLLLGGCVDQGILESQVRQYVRDALLACPYIREVDGFSFSKKGSRVEARFTVHTVYEEFTQKTEVSIR